MPRRISALLFAATALSGCASYHAAPLRSADIIESYTHRDFDPDVTRVELARLAPSATWDGRSWDRLTLLAAALAASPAVAEARAHAVSAAASARAARAGPSMTLTLTGEYARTASESSPWLYGVTSDIPVDIGPRRDARVEAVAFAAIAAGYDYADAVWSARMAIRRALAERFLTAREVAIGEELGRLRARQLAALQNRFEAGEATRLDVERARSEAAADERRLSDAQSRQIAARAGLAQALGVTSNVLADASFVWDEFDAAAPGVADDAVASMKDAALLERADVLRATAAYDQADAELRAAVAQQFPEIHIGPGYTWERGLVKLPFSLGLVLPPLDFAHSGVRAAEAHRSEAGAHLEAVVSNAVLSVETALSERAAAYAALGRVRGVDLQAARHAAEQSDQELADGAIDRVDWAAAQAGWLSAQLAEVDALRRVHAANAALEDALRRPLEGPELSISAAPSARGRS